MVNVLSMLFSVVIINFTKKIIQKTFFAYTNIEDGLHFNGIQFPDHNNDIDKFEELNQNVLVNLFVVDDENEQIVISRKLKKQMLNAILMY